MNIHTLYRVFGRGFRERRMHRFWTGLGVKRDDAVLDVGGTAYNWSFVPERPKLVMLNIQPFGERIPEAHYVIADARRLPFGDAAFNVVFSNSVMEHVGDYQSQRSFASEIRRVGRRYFVQTGNLHFPIELHLLTPFVHWLPKAWQRRLIRNFTLRGLMVRPSQNWCDAFLDEVRLPTQREMRECFPEAELWFERFGGLKKALIAVRR